MLPGTTLNALEIKKIGARWEGTGKNNKNKKGNGPAHSEHTANCLYIKGQGRERDEANRGR